MIFPCTGTLWMTRFILDDCFKVTEIHVLVIKHFQLSPSLTKVLPFAPKISDKCKNYPSTELFLFCHFWENRVGRSVKQQIIFIRRKQCIF